MERYCFFVIGCLYEEVDTCKHTVGKRSEESGAMQGWGVSKTYFADNTAEQEMR